MVARCFTIGENMKVNASDITGFYHSAHSLLSYTTEMISAVATKGITAEQVWSKIDRTGTLGNVAEFSQELNGFPLWGLNNLTELERVAEVSIDYRLACPTPIAPTLCGELSPCWSNAVLYLCAYRVPELMARVFGDPHNVHWWKGPLGMETRVASLQRLNTMTKPLASAIRKEFSAIVTESHTAHVMLRRESAWVYLEMRKFGVIGEIKGKRAIGAETNLDRLKRAIREMVEKEPDITQKKLRSHLKASKMKFRIATVREILKTLAEEGLYEGTFREPRR